MAGNETGVTGGNMSDTKQCAECEQILTEMRAAFLKLMTNRPQGDVPSRDDMTQFLSKLFSSEAELVRLAEYYNQNEFGAARNRWMDHRIATGHVTAFLPVFN